MITEPCTVIELYPARYHAPTLRRQVVESVRRVEHRQSVAPPEDWDERRVERAHFQALVVTTCLGLGGLAVLIAGLWGGR